MKTLNQFLNNHKYLLLPGSKSKLLNVYGNEITPEIEQDIISDFTITSKKKLSPVSFGKMFLLFVATMFVLTVLMTAVFWSVFNIIDGSDGSIIEYGISTLIYEILMWSFIAALVFSIVPVSYIVFFIVYLILLTRKKIDVLRIKTNLIYIILFTLLAEIIVLIYITTTEYLLDGINAVIFTIFPSILVSYIIINCSYIVNFKPKKDSDDK